MDFRPHSLEVVTQSDFAVDLTPSQQASVAETVAKYINVCCPLRLTYLLYNQLCHVHSQKAQFGYI